MTILIKGKEVVTMQAKMLGIVTILIKGKEVVTMQAKM